MKHRLSIYLEPAVMAQLNEVADRKNQAKSLVAEAAIRSFLLPDDTERREAVLARRLDRLTRQVELVERDLGISVEALALFVQYWLTLHSDTTRERPGGCAGQGTRTICLVC